jgi:hypothetical protein
LAGKPSKRSGASWLGNWQLGGSEGFAMVKDADASGIRGLDRARIRLGCLQPGPGKVPGTNGILSMAQQTKRGHVYVISNIGSFGENVYKIGMTRRRDPLDRVRELGDSSVPFDFDVHAMITSDDAPTLEKQLHKHFVLNQVNKVNHRKEFFRATIAEIREELEKLGLQAQWTLVAEATEYRETLAIEKLISSSAEKREAWINRQLLLLEDSEGVEIESPLGDEDAES